MEAVIVFALLTLAAWDAHRRAVADRKVAREFERAVTAELAKDLRACVEAVHKDRKVQADALENFLRQIKEVAKFSAEKHRELEMRAAGKKLPG
jgi:hypothetical protein